MSDSHSRYAVFLSHDSRDKELIEFLAVKLRDLGLLPWFDKWELIPGHRWISGLAQGINSSETCAVFIGSEVLGNWERQELEFAQIRTARDPSFRLIPVLLPGLPDPFDVTTLPPFLIGHTWVDFRKGIDDPDALIRLQSGIRGIAPRSTSKSEVTSGREQNECPYRGLQAFTEDDSEIFFGRNFDTQRSLEKLKATRLLGVLGPSGSGKSSLVRAGVIPRLKEGDLPGSEKWLIVPVFSPGPSPLDALVLNLGYVCGASITGLLELMRDNEHALHTAVRNFLDLPAQRTRGTQRVLLVVDQLEEVFTLSENETDRSQFLANLRYAGSIPGGGCAVVVIMRADFYQKCARYPGFSSALDAEQLLVGAMQREGLVQAIREPARVAGLEFEPGLVETIVDDVSSQPGALPLLEHALLELWKRRSNGQLTLKAYIDTGRVQGAIAKRADAIYDSFDPAEQIVMKYLMLRLTQLGEGTEDTRKPATLEELITRAEDRATVERVIDTLTQPGHRLLTADEKRGVKTIEVSHEALIRGWGRLRKWLDDDRESLRFHGRISNAAKEWREQRSIGINDEGLLYRGLPLARASEWREHHEGELNEQEREFLDESFARERRTEEKALETRNRLAALERKASIRLWYGALGIACLLIAAFAIVLFLNKGRDNDHSRELAALANRLLPDNAALATELAIQSVEISDTKEGERVLRRSLIGLGGVKNGAELGAGTTVTSASFSPDANRVITTGQDNSARVWDVSSKQFGFFDTALLTLNHPAGVIKSADFSPDGKWIITAGNDKTAHLWSAETGKPAMTVGQHEEMINAVAFSREGNWLVTGANDGNARLWKTTTWKLNRELVGPPVPIETVAFSHKGIFVITGSADGTARVWDVASGDLILELKGHNNSVTCAMFTSKDTLIVAINSDRIAQVWDLLTQKVVLHFGWITVSSAAFSADDNWLVTTTYGTANYGKTQVWDDWATSLPERIQKAPLLEIDATAGDPISASFFTPDSKRLLIIDRHKIARIFECEELGNVKGLLNYARLKLHFN